MSLHCHSTLHNIENGYVSNFPDVALKLSIDFMTNLEQMKLNLWESTQFEVMFVRLTPIWGTRKIGLKKIIKI